MVLQHLSSSLHHKVLLRVRLLCGRLIVLLLLGWHGVLDLLVLRLLLLHHHLLLLLLHGIVNGLASSYTCVRVGLPLVQGLLIGWFTIVRVGIELSKPITAWRLVEATRRAAANTKDQQLHNPKPYNQACIATIGSTVTKHDSSCRRRARELRWSLTERSKLAHCIKTEACRCNDSCKVDALQAA